MWCNGLVLSSGFVGLLLLQYTPLLLGGTLFFASQPLLSIVAFQFVPVLLLGGWCPPIVTIRPAVFIWVRCLTGCW